MKASATLRHFLCLASSTLLAIPCAHAADGTWTQTGAGPFDWSAAATGNWSGGIVADGQNSTANFIANITLAQTVNLAEARTIGNITFTDSTTDSHNLTISGANILTLDRSSGIPTINVTQAARTLTISSEIAGNDGLQKIGLGTLTLSGANSITGATTIRSGTLVADTVTNATILSSSYALDFTGTGTFQLKGLSGQTRSQILNGLTLTSGAATIDANNVAGGTSTTIDLRGTGGLQTISRSAGATVDFKATAGTFGTTAIINTAQANNATGILGAWATVNGGADWAINNGSGVVIAYTGYNTLSGTTLASAGTVNYRVATNPTTPTGNITMAAAGTIDINTLRISDTAARTIDVRNGTTQGILRFGAVGGLLTSGGAHVIGVAATPGTITAGGADNTAGELIVNNASALTINSVIANNGTGGTVSLTKSGAGALTLIATNSFTGNTAINGGSLTVGGNNTAATLGPATYLGNIFIAGGASLLFTNSTSQTFSGIISGDGTLQKGGGGTLTLSGANTYTGKTTIAAPGGGGPTVSVSSFNSVNGGTPLLASSSLGAPTTVANGTIQLGSGSNVRACTLIYTGAGETTDRVMSVSFNAGVKQTITSNSTGGGLLKFTSNFTIDPSSGTTTGGLTLRGSGNGEIAGGFSTAIPGILEKADAGTWTLGGTSGANSATVTGGTLIVNGTFNVTTTFAVSSGATLGGTGTTTGALTLNNGSTILGTTAGSSFKAQTVTANASVKIAGSDGSGTIGSHTIGVVRYNTGTGPTTANFSTAGYHAGASVSNVGGAGGETQLTYTNAARTWNSASGTWDAMTALTWQEGDTKFGHGDAVTFDDSGTGGGSARVVTLNSLVTPGSVTFNNSTSTYTVSGTGTIAGLSGLTKSGNGTVTLSTNNTYTGATTVSGGSLIVSAGNINTTSSLSVSAGAKLAYNSSTALTVAPTLNGSGLANRAILGGTGTINAAVILDNIGDTLSPGNSPGIEPFTVGQTWAAFSYDWEVNDFSDITGLTAGSDFDQIGITGGLALTGAAANSYYLNILSLTAGNVAGLAENFSEINRSWNILTTTTGITGFNASYWNINSTGFTNVEGGTWSLAQSGNNLVLSYTVVPEPRAALLGGLGMLMLLRRRR